MTCISKIRLFNFNSFLYFFTHSNLNSNEYFIKNPLSIFLRKGGSAHFFIHILISVVSFFRIFFISRYSVVLWISGVVLVAIILRIVIIIIIIFILRVVVILLVIVLLRWKLYH
ncbi:hypothetical protein MHL_2656 [Mesomycoplasma hyopneumoniae 7422]|nr:hypothetical protein MHL_2656 [Mesomycoplasma hyopneumoniae 7422]